MENDDRIMAMQQAILAQKIQLDNSLGINRERLGRTEEIPTWPYTRTYEMLSSEEGMRYFQEAILDHLHNYRIGVDPYRFDESIGPHGEHSIQDDDQIIF